MDEHDKVITCLCQVFEVVSEETIGQMLAGAFKTNQLSVDEIDRLGGMYGIEWRSWLAMLQ